MKSRAEYERSTGVLRKLASVLDGSEFTERYMPPISEQIGTMHAAIRFTTTTTDDAMALATTFVGVAIEADGYLTCMPCGERVQFSVSVSGPLPESLRKLVEGAAEAGKAGLS